MSCCNSNSYHDAKKVYTPRLARQSSNINKTINNVEITCIRRDLAVQPGTPNCKLLKYAV